MLTALATARAFLSSVTGIVVVALLVLLAIQTVRLEGLSVWPIKIEGWKARSARFEAALDLVAEDQVQARAAQQAAMDREQARYDELAKDADHDHETTRVVVRDATAAFIDRNRVQAGSSCVPSGSDPAPQSDLASVPLPMPDTDFVVVRSDDVRACSDAYAYALNAHLWAMGLAEGE